MITIKQIRREAKESFRSCVENGVLNADRALQIIERLSATGRRTSLGVLSEFHRLVRLDATRREAKVESAAPLSSELQAGVQSSLTEVYGPGLNFSFSQDPSLIGGMRIRVGSDVYDESVKARLAALEQSF